MLLHSSELTPAAATLDTDLTEGIKWAWICIPSNTMYTIPVYPSYVISYTEVTLYGDKEKTKDEKKSLLGQTIREFE